MKCRKIFFNENKEIIWYVRSYGLVIKKYTTEKSWVRILAPETRSNVSEASCYIEEKQTIKVDK